MVARSESSGLTLPSTLATSSAFAFAFLLAAGDYVTPTLVGGTQSVMIGNIIADQFRGTGTNWPLGAALAFIVVGISLLLYLAIAQLIRWVTRW